MGMMDSAPKRLTSFVDGGIVAHEGAALDLVRPQDGTVHAHLVEAGAAGVDAAVASALVAFKANRKSTIAQRVAWLRAAQAAVAREADLIADMICADVGKPIRLAKFEAGRSAHFLDATAGALANMPAGEVVPVDAAANGAGHFGFTRRVPYGVVGAITPFNAPANLLVQKVAPAIAAGNAVVVKPAPSGTRTALAFARILAESGLPKGLFNVVTGDRETALALAAHRDVGAVSFTGGTTAGEALVRAAGVKKFCSELGSNAANLVLADADLDDAAKKIASAGFEASGQQCVSAQRVLVDRSVMEAFAVKLVAAASALKVGAAEDPATDVGSMVHRAAADRVMSMCADAIAHGGRYLLEPKQEACIVSPGILADVPRAARLWQEEVFGPVVILVPFDGLDAALEMANDSPFGLQGSVFTASLASAMRVSEEFDVGALWVNEASRFRLDMYPFGGMKLSGTGREGVRYAIEELSQLKFTGFKP
ncbi:putative aldehyde-dehydrogenase-like protein y4uC [Azorhizobium oxalatiphilum]|uniref:Aldehyde-dehydrogenase-like protein y4uC n=1 Tax=Azorhizobium oxalatiphilum TaxID=980631 RepID=A0A917F7U5_9HYPH|nr:aldehyde dehydrogenase family protein [Azorhizobium oxalatiphilum]GGF54127.1 putative aldehyde-dehydrogenase-like protein y4uC [Azorhizobium oxalatiphilum]